MIKEQVDSWFSKRKFGPSKRVVVCVECIIIGKATVDKSSDP